MSCTGFAMTSRCPFLCGPRLSRCDCGSTLVKAMKLEANRVALRQAGLQIPCCCREYAQLALAERDAEP
jgi:hypothetical protein